MDTKKDERTKWRKDCLESGTPYGVNECDLIRLLNDADRCQELEDSLEYAQALPASATTRSDLKMMLAHAAVDCSAQAKDIAKLEIEVVKLKATIRRLEQDARKGNWS